MSRSEGDEENSEGEESTHVSDEEMSEHQALSQAIDPSQAPADVIQNMSTETAGLSPKEWQIINAIHALSLVVQPSDMLVSVTFSAS
ncbi:hypothetical protein FRC06_009054 [Ceratobasidium sp. 370]|nr:hypothetical protein FRC06_009054 [Ceratobasidium sp. 370]